MDCSLLPCNLSFSIFSLKYSVLNGLRYLEEITELFRDEWMTESEFYGFTKDLSGTHIRAMYDNLLPNYCKIMSFGTMDADCNYISKTLRNYSSTVYSV